MSSQERERKKSKEKTAKAEEAKPEVIEKGKKIKEDIDDLLDKIDDVLEENAEEFVKNYVQKGGE
ncbi:MAG: ubiquitin-like protein Pup [Nitrospirota bacterium]